MNDRKKSVALVPSTQAEMPLIARKVENRLVHQRAIDGYFNANRHVPSGGETLRPLLREQTLRWGSCFSRWLRDNGHGPNTFPTYEHEFLDNRRTVEARLYPNKLITDFQPTAGYLAQRRSG